MTQSREPIFNVPLVVIATIGAISLVHAARTLFLSREVDLEFLLLFAFIPARYEPTLLQGGILPGGWGADLWTFVSYAFIHADVTHLVVNAVWLLAFGSPLARRFGAARFLVFLAVTSAAGAVAHLVVHREELQPMIGASAGISGAMAAAMRFMFQRGGPMFGRGAGASAYRIPAASLNEALREPRILTFIAVWFGINLIFGLGSLSLVGANQSIAWQAHVGGFLAGLLLFGMFDPCHGKNSGAISNAGDP